MTFKSQTRQGRRVNCHPPDGVDLCQLSVVLKCIKIDSRKSEESNDISFIALYGIVFELSVCKYLTELPAESGCKANDPTQYKVDTGYVFYLVFTSSLTQVYYTWYVLKM